MQEKNLIRSLIYIGTCATVISLVLLKREKISKKINKAFNKKLIKTLKLRLDEASEIISDEASNEAIAQRAFEIFNSGAGGSQEEHWYLAERELRNVLN